ncbi:MAG: cytidine deaminase [Tannerella sp.]|jgi:cytidine deaminase|nr:cytidine deaminase [Tannerella sp.]
MEEKKIEFKIKVLKSGELSVEDGKLRDAAIRAAGRAYAPYSHFNVGAAVLLENGTVLEGNNQENIAYPSGLCAERVVLFAAGASFPGVPVIALAIVAIKNGEIQPSISPCGGCRQVALEAERRYGRSVRTLLCGRNDTVIISSARDLLPLSFIEI